MKRNLEGEVGEVLEGERMVGEVKTKSSGSEAVEVLRKREERKWAIFSELLVEDEADVLLLLHRAHVQVLAYDALLTVEAVDELAKMSRKKHRASFFVEQLLNNRRCHRAAFVGTRAPTHLVEDHQ